VPRAEEPEAESSWDFTAWGVWKFDDDGLVTQLESYLPHQGTEAHEAAGLSE
jgi:hypothetical protein